ncbi:MAG: acyltransferase, partial [Ruminococcus sp.]|nr:acyltransferase [Ruminococcus sp.]
MKAKKVLMGYAALLIVFFHFYIPVFKTPLESFIYRSSYIGVDIFFLVSAYSLGRRDKIEFLPFIKNRLKSVYLPFAILTLIAFFYRKWPIKRLLLILCGGEFIKNGGGSFLWFAPGIMFFYLLAPFLAAMKKKFGLKAFAGMICAWFILCLSLQYGLKYNKAFILLNRLPVFFAGMYYDDISLKRTGKFRLPADIIVLAAGLFIIWKTGITRLNKPFADMYYVIAIPVVLAVTDIFELISEKINIVPLAFIGT